MTVTFAPERIAQQPDKTPQASPLLEHTRGVPISSGLAGISITLYDDPAEIKDAWKAFEQNVPACVFQSNLWIETWHRTAARSAGEKLVIAVGRNEVGELAFLWPLAIVTMGGLKVLTWAGQSHSNYNFGLFNPDFTGELTHKKIRILIRCIVSALPGVVAAYFKNQPLEWNKHRNPFASLPRLTSPSAAYATNLADGFGHVFETQLGKKSRSNLKRKEKKLRTFGSWEMEFAQGLNDRQEILRHFFQQKAEQFSQAGITNIFAGRALQEFYRTLVYDTDGRQENFEFYTLKIDGKIVATFNGLTFKNRFFLLLSSITQNNYRRWSPGLILMRYHIEHSFKEGRTVYDLGTGEADHKSVWSNERIDLFDTFLPLHPFGWALAFFVYTKTRAKYIVKNTPALWQFAKRVRPIIAKIKKKATKGSTQER